MQIMNINILTFLQVDDANDDCDNDDISNDEVELFLQCLCQLFHTSIQTHQITTHFRKNIKLKKIG
jgi:hypothetical protein